MSRPQVTRPPWPLGVDGIAFGADYYPEQWPAPVRAEDLELMREAGVNLVALGVFAWATIEPREGDLHWDWLDEAFDALHANGIRIALGTATASPPPWLTDRHPQILPVDHEGRTLWPGGRQGYSISHPVWREYALRMATRMAQRYGDHPALAMWHIDNELAAHVARDYSDASAVAFRTWLQRRYTDIDALNDAWTTRFWSQCYSSFDQVLPPRLAPTTSNPHAELDFRRFASDAWRDWCADLAAAVRPHSPGVPVTTNIITMTGSDAVDLFGWRDAMDFVAVDHYTIGADPQRHVELALAADLSRGIALGAPWLLAEHSTGAVNWQEVNQARLPGETFRTSLAHVARGADGVMFFQWRQSRGGTERFHSAMLPHAGTESRTWRRVLALGRAVRELAPVRGSRVHAEVVLLIDYEAWWAAEQPSLPSSRMRYMDNVRDQYAALWRAGITVDIRHPGDDLSGYRIIVVPCLTLVSAETTTRLTRAAQTGAQVVITAFSGILDPQGHVLLGGYPGAFRELLGVRADEFAPLPEGMPLLLDNGMHGSVWSENLTATDAEVLARATNGPAAGAPVLTRRDVPGGGAAWYVATRLAPDDLDRWWTSVLRAAMVQPVVEAPAGVEVVVRNGDGADYTFVINHTAQEARLPLHGTDLLTGRRHDPQTAVPAGRVAVIRTAHEETS